MRLGFWERGLSFLEMDGRFVDGFFVEFDRLSDFFSFGYYFLGGSSFFCGSSFFLALTPELFALLVGSGRGGAFFSCAKLLFCETLLSAFSSRLIFFKD